MGDFSATQAGVSGADPDGSFEQIVERYSALLLEQARFRIPRVLRRHVDANDVLNDVWAACLPRIGDLSLPDGDRDAVLMRYLSTALVNRINDLSRRFALDPRAARAHASGSVAGVLDELAVTASGIVTKVGRSEESRRLRETLERLDELDREIVILRGLEQHSVGKTAQLVGLSENAVSQRYRRALEKLRARLPEALHGFPAS